MKKYQKFPDNKFIERKWAVVFLHSMGWTTASIHDERHYALSDMKKSKEVAPDFQYKVIRIEVSFTMQL